MKKIIPVIIALMILLCACGSNAETKEGAAVSGQSTVLPDANLKKDDSQESKTDEVAEEVDPKVLEKARSYVGKQLTELIAEFGQPISAEYASSCLGDGEDGLIIFNGFTVETYREGDSEEIRYVD